MTDNVIELKDSERTECEVWTRCMGYFRPVSFYNIGKKQEFADRKCFNEKVALEKCQVKEAAE